MSVRVLGALGFSLAAMTGGAQASSLVFLGISTSTPSVIRVGGTEPIKIASTPSIVALGDAQPEVTYEKVAAIPEKPRHGHTENPMIIRGGIVGGAFAAPAPAKADAAAAPAADTKPAAGTSPAGTATASNGKPQPQPQPQPQPAPPPAPGVGKVK